MFTTESRSGKGALLVINLVCACIMLATTAWTLSTLRARPSTTGYWIVLLLVSVVFVVCGIMLLRLEVRRLSLRWLCRIVALVIAGVCVIVNAVVTACSIWGWDNAPTYMLVVCGAIGAVFVLAVPLSTPPHR